jgi:tetratricopeptide (TPR) repeat protein
VRQAASDAVEEWLFLADRFQVREPNLDWLRALAAAELGGGEMRKMRAAWQEPDPTRRREALERLAAAADVRQLPPRALANLAWRLHAAGANGSAAQLLRRAWRQYPADFWVNEDLGRLVLETEPQRWAEAVRYLTAAVALRPDTPGAHLNLGKALRTGRQLDEAIACFRQAIEIDPKYAAAHTNLGVALMDKGKVEEAIACHRKAIALDPKLAAAHYNLGVPLAAKGEVDEAIACYRKAIALDPKYPLSHYNLGIALKNKGQVEEAIACFRKAIALAPEFAQAHTNLGLALQAKGQEDEAIACIRKAIALDPKLAAAHYNLGNALFRKGKVDEAIACFRQAIALDPKDAMAPTNLGAILCDIKRDYDGAIACFRRAIALDPKLAPAHNGLGFALDAVGKQKEAIEAWRTAVRLEPRLALTHYWLGKALLLQGRPDEALAPLAEAAKRLPAERVRALGLPAERSRAERLARLEKRLPDLLAGKGRPGDNRERLDLIDLCRRRHRFAAAARLFAEAFAAEAKLADDLTAGHRYHAACSAALAAAGRGEDAGKLDATERARLRKRALAWLRADLALLGEQLGGGPPAARAALRHWQQDSALAGIRDKAALDKLPAREHKAFAQLWSDVAALLAKTAAAPN